MHSARNGETHGDGSIAAAVGGPFRFAAEQPRAYPRGCVKTVTSLVLHVIACWLALVFAQRHLGSYDLAPLIDLQHRLHSSQIPGRDFIVTWPPLLIGAVRLVSGGTLHWIDLTVINVVAATACLVSLLLLTTRRDQALLLAALVAIPLLYTNHIWHSSLSQYAAMVSVCAVDRFVREAQPRWMNVILALSGAILLLGKQNVAVPLYLVATAILAVHAKRGLVAWLTAPLWACGFVLSLGMPITTVLESYVTVAGRAQPSQLMFTRLFAIPSVVAALALASTAVVVSVVASRPERRLREAPVQLALAVIAVGLIPLFTDWDAKLNAVPLVLLGALLLGRDAPARSFRALCFAITALAAVFGFTRERMRYVGPFFEPTMDRVVVGGYFDGLHTGPWAAGVIEELGRVSRGAKRPFFGPRIEFGYALTGAPSPRGFPLWWHGGTSYRWSDEPVIVQRFIAADFDTLIFLPGDRTRMPTEILLHIAREYRPREGSPFLEVYVRAP